MREENKGAQPGVAVLHGVDGMGDAPKTARAFIKGWGESPWSIDFRPLPRLLPEQVDFAVVGGGFTGLAAAAWLRKLAPEKSVGVFEAEQIGGARAEIPAAWCWERVPQGTCLGLATSWADSERRWMNWKLSATCNFRAPGRLGAREAGRIRRSPGRIRGGCASWMKWGEGLRMRGN